MKYKLGLVLIIVFLILVSGCKETSQEDSQENTTTSDSESDGLSSQDDSDLVNNISNQTFNWKMAEGTKIKVMLNNHHYADAIVAELADFEALTGIKVEFSLTEENFFFDKVTNALSNEDNDMDVFMTGAYQLWNYDDLGYVENLMPYIENESLTDGDYDFKDFFPELIEVLMSNKDPDVLLAIPIGFELYNLAYNQRIFEERGLEVPATFEEMVDLAGDLYQFDGPGTYGISIRGADNWATVHPAYMSYYRIFGGKDFIEKDGMLTSDLNSPESLTMNEMWAELIQSGSNKEWQDTPWYICADEFGYGKSAMLLDADTISLYVNNNKQYPESGNINWVPLPLPEGYDKRYSNIWTWSLAMNSRSDEKLASWLFIQYFTGYDQLYQSATRYDNGDIPRASIWEDSAYREKLALNKGYIEAFEASIGDASILFTPQPYFFETTTLWANRLREMIVDRDSDIEADLNRLKEEMDRIVHE